MTKDIEFPEWKGYENLEEVKQFISHGCYNDSKQILEYAAKMLLEREYFKGMLLFVQNRVQKHIEEGEGLGLGLDSSKEIFENLILVPAEKVAFPDEEKNEENEGIDNNCERFIKDMEKAGIEYDGEYNGRFFYHGPAVRTNEKGFPTRQDVIRATKVEVQWDNLGLDFIIYPVFGEYL